MINLVFIFIFITNAFVTEGGKNSIELESVDCSKNRLEIALILDASSSIGPENFSLAKQFLTDVVGDFSIGNDKSRIGMITFATDPEILFTLKTHSNIEDIKKAINDAKFLTGVTAMGAAIQLAGTGVLHESRSGIQKVIILLTDGVNNKFPNVLKMARLQKESGVIIITIGIGEETSPDELKEIASPGMYYSLDTFGRLNNLVKTMKTVLCKVLVSIQVDTCDTEGDISFVIDSRERAGELFDTQLELINQVLNRLEISENKQRVAIVIDNEEILVPLIKFSNRTEYKEFLKKKEFTKGSKILSGLVESGKLLAEDKPSVAKLVVILRTQKSLNPEEDKKATHALRSQGCNVVAIAVGKNADPDHLKTLTTTRHITLFQDLSFEVSYINEIAENICQNLKKVYNECVAKKLDVFLVLDCSSSIGPENWLKQLNFVARIIQMLDVGKDATRVGCVYFNTEAYLGFSLDKFDNKNDVINAIKNLPYSEGGTAIGDAMKLAHSQIKTTIRNDTVIVMILITDGQSNIGVSPEAEALKIRNEGIHIICIGISDEISKQQLMRISSTNRLYFMEDFNILETIPVEAITKESCQAVNNEPKNKCRDFEEAGHVEL